MRLYCLNGDPNYPCFCLTIKGCTIMLDCSLNQKQILNFLPQLQINTQRYDNLPNYRFNQTQQCDYIKELNNRIYINSLIEFSTPEFNLINIEDIDCVLISNAHTMLALPYLTKMKKFRGVIYCTEPILHMGRLLMEELTHYLKSNNVEIRVSNDTKDFVNFSLKTKIWKNYSNLLSQMLNIKESHLKPHNWSSIYTHADVDLCISKIKCVGFNQKLNLFGSLYAQPTSSGYSMGSCNWTIEADNDLITYISRSSLLNSHTKPIDQNCIKSQIIDCAIVTGLTQTNASNEPEQMLHEFCKACVLTIKNGGNVLVPTYTTGKVYDLIETLYRYLNDETLGATPVYFISPTFNQSCAYSNIFGEWLCDSKLNQVYAADTPFYHGELIKNGLLKIYPSISGKFNDDFKQPCITFASHPSLRFGDVCHLVDLWKQSSLNSFIFVESEFNYLECLAPYQPIYANYYYFPIDTALNASQAMKLLKESKQIMQLITSESYNCDTFNGEFNRSFGTATQLNFFQQNHIIKLKAKRRYEQCIIENDLANTIQLKQASQLTNDLQHKIVSYTTFTANLLTKNNLHYLVPAPKTIPLTRRDRLDECNNLKKYVFGKLNLEQFELNLKQSGFSKIFVKPIYVQSIVKQTIQSQQSNIFSIEIDKYNSVLIDFNTNSVHIIDNNEETRNKIRDALLKCLNTF